MVNLLGRRARAIDPPRFEATEVVLLEARLSKLFALDRSARLLAVASTAEVLAAELEELDAAPARIAAESLLGALDTLRDEVLAGAPEIQAAERAAAPPAPAASPDVSRLAGLGGFVCHRPGRSLATGEAEIASRGLFDAWDRPPIAGWVGVLPAPSETGVDGVWIVAWVAAADLERAWAGCRASPNGALARIEEVSSVAASQLRAAAEAAADAAV